MKLCAWLKNNKSECIQIFIAAIILIACLLPLFLIAQFTVPMRDDFAYGYSYFKDYAGDLGTIINLGVEHAGSMYNNWQGTYLSSFLAFCNPFYFYGIEALPLAFSCIILLYVLGVFFAVNSVMRHYFGCRKFSVILWIYTGFIFLTTQLFNLSQTFFWYTGAVAYIVPFSIYLFAFTLFIKAYKSDGAKMITCVVTSAALSAAASGGSLNINVFFVMLMFAVCLMAFYYKKARRKKIVSCVILGVTIAFTLLNLLSPGYQSRMNQESELEEVPVKPSFLKNLIRAFRGCIEINTVVVPIVITMAVIILLIYIMLPYLKNKKECFSHPILLLCYIGVMLYFCVLPIVFGYGRYELPVRFTTVTGFMGIASAFFYFAYLTGWILNNKHLNANTQITRLILFSAGFLTFIIGMSITPISGWNSYNILVQFDNMVIQKNYANIKGVLAHVENSAEDDVYVDYGMIDTGNLLWSFEIFPDPTFHNNHYIAQFYGKKSVQLATHQ